MDHIALVAGALRFLSPSATLLGEHLVHFAFVVPHPKHSCNGGVIEPIWTGISNGVEMLPSELMLPPVGPLMLGSTSCPRPDCICRIDPGGLERRVEACGDPDHECNPDTRRQRGLGDLDDPALP